ncbi:MAG TPA: fibronectin type III domain-containing protein [Turneriella sp.]|nr:fibronectin type III domain-containing protein [Turneriella sp.]
MSTKDALDAAFISSAGTTFKFTAPGTMLTYTQVKISIEARNGLGQIVPYFDDDVSVTAIGTGTLYVISQTAFSGGRKDIFIRYNKTLTVGQTELISLRATSMRSSAITGASDGIVAVPAAFTFTTPSAATPTTAFSATINARAADGGVNTGYNGTVKLAFDNAVGSLNPATATLVNGTATVNITFTGTPNAKFRLVATDSNSPHITGTSSDICMGCGLSLVTTNDSFLNLIAVPLSATQLRLSWNKMPDATGYNVYKKVTGSYVQQGATTGNTFYNDTGLTAGTTYEYRVDAVNASATVLSSTNASASPAACTTTIATNITAPITWNATSAPVCVTASISITGDGTNGGIIFSAAGVGPTYSLDGLYTYVSGSTLQYAIIEYATRGVFSNTAGVSAEFSVFRHNRAAASGYAIYAAPSAGSTVLRSNHFNNNSASAGSTKSAAYLLQTGGLLCADRRKQYFFGEYLVPGWRGIVF